MLRAEAERAGQASVLVKVIQVPRDPDEGYDNFDALLSRIVAGTNWQNAINAADLMANDRKQIELERELRKLGYLYIRKRQSKGEAKRAAGGKHCIAIRKDELAVAVAGCDLDPVVPRSGRDNLFEEDMYPKVFPNSDPDYYLPRYWLMREVTYCARGLPERAYAKWLVLGFVWSKLSPLVRAEKHCRFFRHNCERQASDLVVPLSCSIGKVFVAALRYFREARGTGETAIDVSTFFRNKRGRDQEFRAFWQGGSNKSSKGFDRYWRKVEAAILQGGS
jgi:hypothetical protein